jgi:hypothetical protein
MASFCRHPICRNVFREQQNVFAEDTPVKNIRDQQGKIGYIILWLMGVPAGILILIFLLRGCT